MTTVLGLRTTFAQGEPALRAAAGQLWRPGGLHGRYREYLRVMHAVVRASVPLMQLAARRCDQVARRDPVAGPLADYLRAHVEEERDHDAWLLADLAALGEDVSEPLARPPVAVARLVGPQYYWIEHYHPVALLGYIAVLEANAPSTRLPDRLTAAGIPQAAVRTVRAHAVLDEGHADDVYRLLDGLPLTEAQARAVAVSGLHTTDALITLYGHITWSARRNDSGRRTRP